MGVWDSSYNFRLLFHRAAALKGGAGPQPSGPQMARGGLAAALATDWGLLLSAQVGPGGIQCMTCPGMRVLCLPPSGGLRLISPRRVGGKLGSKDENDAVWEVSTPTPALESRRRVCRGREWGTCLEGGYSRSSVQTDSKGQSHRPFFPPSWTCEGAAPSLSSPLCKMGVISMCRPCFWRPAQCLAHSRPTGGVC